MKGVQMTSSRAVLITVAQVCVIVIILHRLYPRLRASPPFWQSPSRETAYFFTDFFRLTRRTSVKRRAYSWRIYNLSDPLNLIDLSLDNRYFFFILMGKFHSLFSVSTSLQCLHHVSQLVSFKCKESRISSTLAFSATLPEKKKPKSAENDKSKSREHKISSCL